MFSITLFIFRKIKNISYVSDWLFWFAKYIKTIHEDNSSLLKTFLCFKSKFQLENFLFYFSYKSTGPHPKPVSINKFQKAYLTAQYGNC